jgi:PRTRC genetic system protein E
MFKTLHALAQKNTLLITIAAEGDLLRVALMPAPEDGGKSSLKPLSLLATPEELDAEFGSAIEQWQAPRKSLMQQVAEAQAEADDDEAEEKEEGKASGGEKSTAKRGPKKNNKAVAPAKAKGKPNEEAATNPDTSPPPAGRVDPRQTSLIEDKTGESGQPDTANAAPPVPPVPVEQKTAESTASPESSPASGTGESTTAPTAGPTPAVLEIDIF